MPTLQEGHATRSCINWYAVLRRRWQQKRALLTDRVVVTTLTGASVSARCDEVGLTVNPTKAAVVAFTRSHQMEGIGPYLFRESSIEMKSEVKYLG
ncbi:hypothetical protein J6590_103846 [Homalodisca vitripennis]|nr:hypothetical protein J6590_103846 [Homalodisca vitripennis]